MSIWSAPIYPLLTATIILTEISLPLGVTYILTLPLVLHWEVVYIHIGSSWHWLHFVTLSLPVLIFLDQLVVQWRPGVHWPMSVPALHSCHTRQHCHCWGCIGTAVFYLICICMGKGQSSVFRCYLLQILKDVEGSIHASTNHPSIHSSMHPWAGGWGVGGGGAYPTWHWAKAGLN